MTGNMISVETSGTSGQMGAYMATPDNEGAPGLVIIQEVFGVNDFVRATVEAYAAKGFVTAAPDIFWRLEPGVQLNPNEEAEFNRGIELMGQFDQPTGIEDIQATITALRNNPSCNGKVGVLGFVLVGALLIWPRLAQIQMSLSAITAWALRQCSTRPMILKFQHCFILPRRMDLFHLKLRRQLRMV